MEVVKRKSRKSLWCKWSAEHPDVVEVMNDWLTCGTSLHLGLDTKPILFG